MLRLRVKLCFLGSLLLFLSLGFYWMRGSVKDEAQYALLESSQNSKPKKGFTHYCEQSRKNVTKHVFLQKEERLAGQVTSQSSILFFFPQGKKKMDIVEEMEDVSCLFQEKLLVENGEPAQEVCFFMAKKANHNYTSNLFVAEEVKIWKYKIPGHHLPEAIPHESPLMEGDAQELTLSLENGEISMKASHMRLSFDSSSIPHKEN